MFDASNSPLYDVDDTDTYCENVPYNITTDNAVFDNIGLV